MRTYALVKIPFSDEHSLLMLPEWTFIPQEESNASYQAYLAWVAEGNEAETWENE